MLLLQSAAANL